MICTLFKAASYYFQSINFYLFLFVTQVIGTSARCDRYELEWYKASNSEKWQTYYKKSKWLFDYIAENTQVNLDGLLILDIIDQIAEIGDTIHVIVGNFT